LKYSSISELFDSNMAFSLPSISPMSNFTEIRNLVREALMNEFMMGESWDSNNDVVLFHGGGMQKFPYGDTDLPENLPELNRQKDMIKALDDDSWKSYSSNKDVYEFPMDEFKKGMEVELRARKAEGQGRVDVLELGMVVLDRLQDDPHHYSGMEQVKS